MWQAIDLTHALPVYRISIFDPMMQIRLWETTSRSTKHAMTPVVLTCVHRESSTVSLTESVFNYQ